MTPQAKNLEALSRAIVQHNGNCGARILEIAMNPYEAECACLVGTIANVRHEPVEQLKEKLRADPGRPAEQWFAPIRKGDKPSTDPESEGQFRAQKAVEWIDEWRESRGRIAEALR